MIHFISTKRPNNSVNISDLCEHEKPKYISPVTSVLSKLSVIFFVVIGSLRAGVGRGRAVKKKKKKKS